MKTFTTDSDQATRDLARKLAADLKGGEVIGLVGNLGAGKTVFSQGLAEGLGIIEPVTSPTFVVMKVYPVSGHPSIKQFCHIDAYRLRGAADLAAIGAEDYIGAPDTLTAIEWADKIREMLPPKTITINFERKIINNNQVAYVTIQRKSF